HDEGQLRVATEPVACGAELRSGLLNGEELVPMSAVRPPGRRQARSERSLKSAQPGPFCRELGEERGDRLSGHFGCTGRISEEGSEFSAAHHTFPKGVPCKPRRPRSASAVDPTVVPSSTPKGGWDFWDQLRQGPMGPQWDQCGTWDLLAIGVGGGLEVLAVL